MFQIEMRKLDAGVVDREMPVDRVASGVVHGLTGRDLRTHPTRRRDTGHRPLSRALFDFGDIVPVAVPMA